MPCTDFLAKMTDFFAGEVEPHLLQEIRSHLLECDHCEILVNTTRQTIQVYRDHKIYDLPMEARERTVQSIMARCRR